MKFLMENNIEIPSEFISLMKVGEEVSLDEAAKRERGEKVG